VSPLARRYLVPFAVLALGAAAGFSLRNGRLSSAAAAIGLEKLPLALVGYRGRELPSDDSVFAYLGADEMIDRVYLSEEGQHAVKLSVVFARGWRALHSPRDCFKNQGWSPIEDRQCDIPATDGAQRPIHGSLLIMSKQDARMAAVYTFSTGTATTGSWLLHSLRMAVGQGPRGGMLIVAVAGSAGPEQDDDAAEAATEVLQATGEFCHRLLQEEGKPSS